VISDPEPTIVLIVPAANPTATRRTPSQNDMATAP
jgi:hypothetical protein